MADRSESEAGEELLTVTVEDDGVGLPETPYTEGLGLQIVRTLVTSELGGTIAWKAREGNGTAVQIVLSLATR
jgi:two-component sensor histidine kinase